MPALPGCICLREEFRVKSDAELRIPIFHSISGEKSCARHPANSGRDDMQTILDARASF